MKLELIKLKAPDLDIPELLCDGNPLGKHLNKWQMLSYLNSYSFTAIIERPGFGKTSLLISFLLGKGKKRVFRKVFNHIFVLMPPTSIQSMKENPLKNHPADKMFDELNYDNIDTIYNRLLEASKKGEKTLLIMDDIGAAMKNKEIQKLLRLIIYNRRHLKVHIVCLLQSYMSIPKEVRKLITNAFIFKPSRVEFENQYRP